jgi:hypothetical protein
MIINVCERCARHLEVGQVSLQFSSAGFSYCPVCHTYTETPVSVAIEDYTVISEDACDCGDQVRHTNGGNYHYTAARAAVLAVLENDIEI